MKFVMSFTNANFEEEVLWADLPVLVDFWASWCPPCKMVEPVISELAEEYKGRVKVGKLNVDQNPKRAAKFGIKGLPTFVLFVNGVERDRRKGAHSKEQLKQMLKEVL